MIYRVEFTDRFTRDIDQHLAYLQQQKVSLYTTNRWYAKL